MKKNAASAALMLVVLTACGGPSFAESDPDGFEACQYLAKSETGGDQVVNVVAAGEAARTSSTKAIRDAAGDGMGEEFLEGFEGTEAEGVDLFFPDADALKAACQDEGFEF